MIAKTLRTNLVIQAVTFATSILIARILGPTGRGELALVLLYPQLVGGIAFIGIDRAVAILGGRRELAHPVATIIKLSLLFSIPALLAGYATVTWCVADPHLARLATAYLIYMPAMHFFLLVVALFNGTGDFSRFNLARLGFYIINFALVLAIWIATPTILPLLDWVLLANLVAVYGVLVLAIWLLRGANCPAAVNAVAGKCVDLRSVLGLAAVFALPVALAQLSNSAYQIAVEQLMGVKTLGFFVVFLSYSRLLSPIGGAINSHVFHAGISGGKRDIARIFRLSFLGYLVCSVPLWLSSGWLIPMFFGKDFIVDSRTLSILFASTLLALLADSMAEYLNGQRKVAADIVGRLAYLATLGILAVWLTPLFGILGIAIAMATGDLLRCAYLVRQVALKTENAYNKFWLINSLDLLALLHAGKRMLRGVCSWR